MRKVIKFFAVTVFSLLVLVVFVPLMLAVAMSLPSVQNAVGHRVVAHFSEKLGTTVSFEKFEVRRFNRVQIDGLYIADYKGDTLLYVPQVEAPIEQFPVMGRPMIFGRVELKKARMWIHRDSLGKVNIRQIVRTARGTKPRNPNENFRFYINGISANDITFALTRDDRELRSEGVDFSRFIIHNTHVDISRLAIEGSDLHIAIDGLDFVERTGWRVDDLRGELTVGRGLVALRDVEIDSEGSRLSLPRIGIEGSNWRSFRHFADSVALDISLVDSRVGGEFLRYFVPAAERFVDIEMSDVSASVAGPLGALTGMVSGAGVGDSELVMEFSSRGLPNVENAEFEGIVSRFSSTGADLKRFYKPLADVGGVEFGGRFSGSLQKGVGLVGSLTVNDFELGKVVGVSGLSSVDGEFEVEATVGRNMTARATGAISDLAFDGRRVGEVSVDGEWADGAFFAVLNARDPGREWGLHGDLTAVLSGVPDKVDASAELRNFLYLSPRGSVVTPRIDLKGTFSPTEKGATFISEFADAEVKIVDGEVIGVATVKNGDGFFAAIVPGLQVAEGARASVRFDRRTHAGELNVNSQFVEYRGALLTDASLKASVGGDELKAALKARDFYSGALHIPDLSLDSETSGQQTRLSLDGANYLTVSGLSTRKISDSLHIDLGGFDLAALGGLTPKGTRIVGYMDVVDKKRVEAEIGARNIDAALLEPFIGSALRGTTGRANIEVRAMGDMRELKIDGAVELLNLSSTVSYTGARYSVDSARIEISDSHATLLPTMVRDGFGGEGDLAMEIDVSDPGDTKVALRVAPRRLLAFDKRGSGSLNGRVFVSGDVSIDAGRMGTTLDVDVTTDPGTQVDLPFGAKSGVEWVDFVTFTAPTAPQVDTTRNELGKRLQNYTHANRDRRGTSLEVDMTVRVTDEAEVRLSIDPRLGRGITAKGEGVIGLGIDPASRAVSVTGDYTIGEGRFDFSMMDVLSKNFTIAPGSTIRWSGAPDEATLDVKALYRVRTSLAPLLGEGSALVSERANVPVDCILRLESELSEPQVSFDIELPSADADQKVIAAQAMNTDELKSMQFLSLLVTGNFASAQSIGAGTGASTQALASGSVGFDILTSQLGNLLSSDDYDVYFRYRPEDNFLTNRFDMGFQAGFVHDRLRLEIEGNYVDDRAAASLGTVGGVNNLAGDVSLTWVIDRGGNLRLKVFSQTIDRLNETQGLQESGIGVYYRKDFNRLGDIFRSERRRRNNNNNVVGKSSVSD